MSLKDHDNLLKHSLVLLAGTQVGNVANLLFQMAMMRKLPSAEYGVLATMLSLILVLGTPLAALNAVVAHGVARLTREGLGAQIRSLVARWNRPLLLIGTALVLVGALARVPLAHYFQISQSSLLMLTAGIMALSLFPPIYTGALQGAQAFIWLSAASQVWGVMRLVLGVALVYFVSAQASMAMAAQFVGVVVAVAVGYWGLRRVAPEVRPVESRMVEGAGYFGKSLLILFAYAVLMNMDISLVKHYFDPVLAGEYARASTIGRAIIFLPMPIAAALFPKVVSTGAMSSRDVRILWQAVLYVLLIIVGAATVCVALAPLIWRLFTGQAPSPELLQLIRWVVIAMSPLGLTYLLMNFELAQNRFMAAFGLIPCAAGFVGSVMLWHQTRLQVVTALGVAGVVSAAVLVAGLPWRTPRTAG